MSPLNLYCYDLETLFNCFLFCGKFYGQPEIQMFEISSRMNQRNELLQWLNYLQNAKVTMVGYNSVSFDYPVLHRLITEPYTFTYEVAYAEAQKIITSQRFGAGANPHTIWLKDRLIPQLDLMKVHHFDNATKATSLKSLQFAMRLESVEDMPVAHNVALTHEQMDMARGYNINDVMATDAFTTKSMPAIQIRQELLESGVLYGDVLNYSDVKIGTEYLVRKIGRTKCYTGNKPKQSLRNAVALNSVILPKINFRSENFESVREWFAGQTIFTGSTQRPGLESNLGGLEFHFGLGGVHASVKSKKFTTTETHIIKDIDVGGMYPAVSIANDFSPEHLGNDFVVAYRQLKADRANYAKEMAMNKVLKLASNGAFGNAGNVFSPFFDLKFLYSITVNGQLQLLQLVEMLSTIPGLELIQANTDGITALVPRVAENFFNMWCADWEAQTKLKLEYTEYDKMWIRDVNNYLAIDMKGKVKRKGAYWYPTCEEDYWGGSGSNWNKDFSNMAIQKTIEQVLVNNWDPESILRLLANPFDFMSRYKTPSGAKVFIGDKQMLKTVRYYVSTAGEPMKKVSTPKGQIGAYKRKSKLKDSEYHKILNEIGPGVWDDRIHTKNKSKYEMVSTNIENGRLIKACNHVRDFNWKDVDFDYYVKEVEKLRI